MSELDLACTRWHPDAYGVQYKDWKLSEHEENPRADLPSFLSELRRAKENGVTAEPQIIKKKIKVCK